ncbi:MAG TPA: hypothetical protein VMC41_02355 [Candidatus Nanoarchaeia archaeon]|nr:hypothetical protein [Candidatus Nanoarchaeia archaeon]
MSYIEIVMPEMEEGKEAGTVCYVKDADIEKVKQIVLGKGYGVQGTDSTVWINEVEKITSFAPILNFDDFAKALSQGELNWYYVVEWQRWHLGYVDCEKKTIVLNKEGVRISTCFVKNGYDIVVRPLPRMRF